MGRTYRRLLRTLPRSIRTRVDESVQAVVRPRVGTRFDCREEEGVRFEPWMHGARAGVCISSDFELAWASQYVGLDRALDEGNRTRRYLPVLLRAFDDFRIPVTWATVGHLFLESCGNSNDTRLAHPEMPRPPHYRNRYWAYEEGDWYQNDPCTSVSENPEWYASDLLDSIVESDVQHEIGCHSFSHTDFSDVNCPADVALADLRECQQEASHRGIHLRSFVFPGNFEGNFAALHETGFIAYRGSGAPELSYPAKNHNLWNVRGSLQLFDPDVDYSVRLARFLETAVRTQTCCHLNFHPSEPDAAAVSSVLVPVLRELRKRERRGDIWIGTMGEIASFCETRASATLRSTGRLSWKVNWGRRPLGYLPGALTISLPWKESVPTVEIDGVEWHAQPKECFERDGRFFLTLRAPQETFSLHMR